MQNVTLSLGDVTFGGFEIPASVSIDGKQRLAIHRLMGGAQVIDVLGRDKETVSWSGVLSGANAVLRSCALDRLRLAGLPLMLSWDVYTFEVLIDGFTAEYRNPSWIPYSLSCSVLQDVSSPVVGTNFVAIDLINSDVASSAQYANVSGLQSILSSGGIVPGSAAYAAAIAAGYSAQSMMSAQMVTAGAALSGNFTTTLAACGTMAGLAAGTAYLGRAIANLTNLEP